MLQLCECGVTFRILTSDFWTRSMRLSLLFLMILPALVKGFDPNWLPQGTIYPTRYLDPAASQQSISVMTYEVEGESQQLMYVPVSVGLRQMFLRSMEHENRGWEVGMEFNIYSQFSVVDVGEAFMGGLQNTDYRISGIYHYQHSFTTLSRLSFFHQSSHLGDDHIIRNSITTPTLRTLNYEQLDYTFLHKTRGRTGYAAVGYNVSPNTVRKRLMLQVGGDLSYPMKAHGGLAWIGGMDIKIYEHNDYRPNLRFGAGLEFARRTQTPTKILLSYYQGQLPYSTLEYQKVRLIGLSLCFNFPSQIDTQ